MFVFDFTSVLRFVAYFARTKVKLSFEGFDDVDVALFHLHRKPLQPITLPLSSRTASPGATTSVRSAGTALRASALTM